MTDHPTPCAKETAEPRRLRARGARAALRDRPQPRLERRETELPRDDSSLVIAVDHNACILCDRCVRGCNDIKENHVIGRMGKGYTARIAFDLDVADGRIDLRGLRRVHGLLPDRRADAPAASIETELPAGERRRRRRSCSNTRSPRSARRSRACRTPFLRSNIHAVKRRALSQGRGHLPRGRIRLDGLLHREGLGRHLPPHAASSTSRTSPASGFWGAIGRFTSKLTIARPPATNVRRLHPHRRPGRLALRPAAGHDERRRHLRRDDLHEPLPALGDRHARPRIARCWRCSATSSTSCSAARHSAACSRRSTARARSTATCGACRSSPRCAATRSGSGGSSTTCARGSRCCGASRAR